MNISKTDIRAMEHLLRQCSIFIERTAPKVSPDQDLARRCKQMIKKLKKKRIYDTYMV